MSNIAEKIKRRNESKKSTQSIEKRIRFLQRELVRATFKGKEKEGLSRKLLRLIQQERLKIQQIQRGIH